MMFLVSAGLALVLQMTGDDAYARAVRIWGPHAQVGITKRAEGVFYRVGCHVPSYGLNPIGDWIAFFGGKYSDGFFILAEAPSFETAFEKVNLTVNGQRASNVYVCFDGKILIVMP